MFPWCCLPEMVWFIAILDHHLQAQRKAWASPINLHPVPFPVSGEEARAEETRRQSRVSFSAAVRREEPRRVTPSVMMVPVMLGAFLLIRASWKPGAVTSTRCWALCLLTNALTICGRKWGEFSGREPSTSTRGQRRGGQQYNTGTHEYHSGLRPCARWRRPVSCIPAYDGPVNNRPQTWGVWLTTADGLSHHVHHEQITSKTRKEFLYFIFCRLRQIPHPRYQ